MRKTRDSIVELSVDAIVNAAKETLRGGGGVDGSIQRKAGPGLLEECRRFHGCRTGDAKITGGYCLAGKHIIHPVGPVWRGAENGEAELLTSSDRRSLEIAVVNGVRTVAIPAISCGVYHFPEEAAAVLGVGEVKRFLEVEERELEAIWFVCFTDGVTAAYEALFEVHG
ncbi:MAG: macro domain-containing protein [Verrucomicrobiota bacterium]